MFFPCFDSMYMCNYVSLSDSTLLLHSASNHTLLINAYASLGPFKVYIVPKLKTPLISESYLTTNFHILIIRYNTTTWILDSIKYKSSKNLTDYVIAKADLSDDGLYRLTNLMDLVTSTPLKRKLSRVQFHANLIQSTTSSVSDAYVKPTSTHKRGRYQGRFSHLLGDLNPLEVLKVRLGFPNIKTLRHLIKHQAVHGLDTTTKQIQNIFIRPALAEYQGGMRSFPIYPSITSTIHQDLFETWSVDPVPMPIKSIEGYIGYFSFVEKSVKFRHVSGYKQSTTIDLLNALDILIQKYGPRANRNAHPMRVLILDAASTHLSDELHQWCLNRPDPSDPIIHRNVSAPYKHQQNLIETYINHEKNLTRTNLAYNYAPDFLWFKALRYTIVTINLTLLPDTSVTRQEAMTGIKPDVSHYVPFYATGYALAPKELRSDTLDHKAIEVKMIGYGDDLDEHKYPNMSFKQSYQCYIPPNKVIIRHDVIWEHLAPQHSLMNPSIKDRFPETFNPEQELINELVNLETINTSNDEAQPMVEHDIPSTINNPTYTDSTENNNDMNYPKTRSFYEPEYFLAKMAKSGKLQSQIFHDIPTLNTPDISEANTRTTHLRSGGRVEDDSDLAETIPSTTHTQKSDNPIYRSSLPKNNYLRSGGRVEDDSDLTETIPSTTRTQWLRSIFPSYTHSSANQTANLSNAMPSNLFVRDDDTIVSANEPFPSTIVDDIMHDYNRVIRQILIDDHVRNQSKLYDLATNRKSHYKCPTNHLQDTCFNTVDNISYTSNIAQTTTKETPTNATNATITSTNPIFHLPLTLEEALARPDGLYWRNAWEQEMSRLELRHTWSVNDPPPSNQKPIKSKYVFKIKVNRDGTLKYKVRLCACGYSQKYGIDYDETFAPTAKYKSLCTVLTIAASNHWTISGIDVENAFVEADIDRPLWMTLPKGTYRNNDDTPITVKLLKSLYGLKQAPELWDKFLVNAIKKQHFKQLMHDQCIFLKTTSNGDTIILVKYVDDIIITGNNPQLVHNIIKTLEKEFTKLTSEADLKRYVGLDIDYDHQNGTLQLSQKPMIRNILQKFDIDPNTIVSHTCTPLNPRTDYRQNGDNTIPPMRDLTGNLRFLADRTLPNILASCSLLSSHAHNPAISHRAGGDQALKYLNSHQNDHIVLGGDPHITLFGYADAAHIMNDDSKSQLGFCFYLNETSGAVIAKSKRDTTVSHSSTEAEIKAIDLAIREATWFRGFLNELGYPQTEPTVIYTDNLAATILSETNNINDKTGHMVLRINYIYQEQKAGNIKLKWINTENNVADILTKPLPCPSYEYHSKTLMHGHDGISPEPAAVTNRDKKRSKSKRKQRNNSS